MNKRVWTDYCLLPAVIPLIMHVFLPAFFLLSGGIAIQVTTVSSFQKIFLHLPKLQPGEGSAL